MKPNFTHGGGGGETQKNITQITKVGCGAIADDSLTKQICPVTPNTSYETTALSIVYSLG